MKIDLGVAKANADRVIDLTEDPMTRQTRLEAMRRVEDRKIVAETKALLRIGQADLALANLHLRVRESALT